ncbi:MAG: flavodoxin domain-containing protein [Chloroflexota bacterium]
MQRILIVHASRHGGSAGIAEKIGGVLRAQGLNTVLARAVEMPDPRDFDACVVGSGVYIGSWLKEGTDYLARFHSTLAAKPVWLFSSGPLPGWPKGSKQPAADPLEDALGPADGPGSGGRKKLAALADAIQPRDHRVFRGAFDPSDPPKSLAERVVRMMPASKDILPVGDFRDWPAIEAWALEIATELGLPTVGTAAGPAAGPATGPVPIG